MEPLSSALIFPETEPSIHDIGNLLFFFNSLSYYLPTESDAEGLIDQNLFDNLCAGYVPAPLHEDLNRFNRLLGEMENSRSDDLARLFSSAKSPIATGQIRDRDEASSGSILSALQEDNGKKAHIQLKERLWQARLILKLAEMLNRRESEVRQGLEKVSSDEQKNFASLAGSNGTESGDPAQFSALEKPLHLKGKIEYPEDYSAGGSAMLVPLRIKAWAELFLADSSPSRPSVIVTTNPDSGSILLDRYENTWRKTPQKLFSLSIPMFPGLGSSESAKEQYIASRIKLRLAAKEDLKYFENFLTETAVSHDSSSDRREDISIDSEHIAAWEETIKIEFPSSATGYQQLDFYCFPGIPSCTLLQKLFHLEPTPAVNEQGYTTSILAILHT
jgi:hypothetical protein